MLDLTRQPLRPLVAPSVLASDFGRMAEDAGLAISAGGDLLHVDVMDGHFVPNLTFGADMIAGLRRHLPGVLLDVHLMVDRPQDYVKSFANAGADVFTFHMEVCEPYRTHGVDAREMVEAIRDAGMLPGVVINPRSPVSWLEEVLGSVSLVLLMSVQPGQGGQAFQPSVLDKARAIKPRLRADQRLEIDGGINAQTAKLAVEAGVEVLVAGSYVFNAKDRAAAIASLREK